MNAHNHIEVHAGVSPFKLSARTVPQALVDRIRAVHMTELEGVQGELERVQSQLESAFEQEKTALCNKLDTAQEQMRSAAQEQAALTDRLSELEGTVSVQAEQLARLQGAHSTPKPISSTAVVDSANNNINSSSDAGALAQFRQAIQDEFRAFKQALAEVSASWASCRYVLLGTPSDMYLFY